MKRLIFALLGGFALSIPALAADLVRPVTVQPGSGPTQAGSSQVPSMKVSPIGSPLAQSGWGPTAAISSEVPDMKMDTDALKVIPGLTPTEAMTGQVPEMKTDESAGYPALQKRAASTQKVGSVGKIVPPMKPSQSGTGQNGTLQ